MKKFVLPLLFMMLVPFVVYAETCDIDKITIDNITIENKSNNVEEIEEAAANGKNINLNLSMSEVGDNIEYNFVVKNESNEDYELDNTGLNLNTDHINYSFKTEDNSNIVKANSSKKVSLRVEYKTEVPEEKFESGTYNDNKTVTVQLSNDNKVTETDTTIGSDTTINSEVVNVPDTEVQSYFLVVIVLFLISITLYIVLKKKKYIKFMILLVGITILIPISVYALCKCEINIESRISISKKYSINYVVYETIKKDDVENHIILKDTDGNLICMPSKLDDYYVCQSIILKEYHNQGEIVNILNHVKFNIYDTNNNIIEQEITIDGNVSTYYVHGVNYGTDIYYYSRVIHKYKWQYNNRLNPYNNIDDLQFQTTESINWDGYGHDYVNLIAPNNFKVPNHDVYFVLY